MKTQRNILITGACGYVGHELIKALADKRFADYRVVALDIRDKAEMPPGDNFLYVSEDIRSSEIESILVKNNIDTVVHLASIVTPGKGQDREFAYSVDVGGTANLLKACVNADVKNFIVTSSGAAYGYHPDSPRPLVESSPLRGNDEFAYSRHKRLVEEMLAKYRKSHPALKQLILRPGTILGANVSNQITNLFEKKAVLGIVGYDTPFVFIWDRDVVGILLQGIEKRQSGIFNLAGDGALPLKELAKICGKPYLALPAFLLQGALSILHALHAVRYGPEQLRFLMSARVLANHKLKQEFGYEPALTSREVFDLYLKSRNENAKAAS